MENNEFDEESSIKDVGITEDPIKQDKDDHITNDETIVKLDALSDGSDCKTAPDVSPNLKEESVVIPADQESVVIPTDQAAMVIPIDLEAVVMLLGQDCVAIPTGQDAVIIPIDQKAVVIPTGQDAVVIPIDQEAVVIPIDQEAVVMPTDQKAVAMPIDQESDAVVISIDQEAMVMPIDQEAVGMPIDQDAVVMPIGQDCVVIPTGQHAVAISTGQVQEKSEIEEIKVISDDRTEMLTVSSREIKKELISSEPTPNSADLNEARGIKTDTEISSKNDDANPKFEEGNEESLVIPTPNGQAQVESEIKVISEDRPETSTVDIERKQELTIISVPLTNSAELTDAGKIKTEISSKNDGNANDSDTPASCAAEVEVDPEVKQIKVEVMDEFAPESWNVTNEELGSEYRVINVDSADDEASSSKSEKSSDDSSSTEEVPERNVIEMEDEEDRVKKRGPVVLNSEIRTKGELYPEDLPPIEDLQITVNANEPMLVLGKVSGIVGILVIVQANVGVPALNEETALFLKERQVLGQVFETFGPVVSPFYSLRFNSTDDINEKGISIGLPVYYAPKMSVTHYVFMQSLLLQKGSDASWDDSNEPPNKYMEYSDDEAERTARSKMKAKHKAEQGGNDEDEKSPHERANKNRRNRRSNNQNDPSKSQEIFSGTSWPPSDRTNPKMARSHGSSKSKPSQDAERFLKQFQQGPRMPPYIRSSQFPSSQVNSSNRHEQHQPQNGAMAQPQVFRPFGNNGPSDMPGFSRTFGNNGPSDLQGVQMSHNGQQQFGFNQSQNRCGAQERPIFGRNRFSGQEKPVIGHRGCSEGPRFSGQGSTSFGPGRFQEGPCLLPPGCNSGFNQGGQNFGSLSSQNSGGPQRHFQNDENVSGNTFQGQGQNPGEPQGHFQNNGNVPGNTFQGQGQNRGGPQRHFQNNVNMPGNTFEGQGQNPGIVPGNMRHGQGQDRGGPQRQFQNDGNVTGKPCQGQGNIFPPSGQQRNGTFGMNAPTFQNRSETMNSNQMALNGYQNQSGCSNSGEFNCSNLNSQSMISAPNFVDTRLMPNSDNM